jgi:hypothetical protein
MTYAKNLFLTFIQCLFSFSGIFNLKKQAIIRISGKNTFKGCLRIFFRNPENFWSKSALPIVYPKLVLYLARGDEREVLEKEIKKFLNLTVDPVQKGERRNPGDLLMNVNAAGRPCRA